MVELQNQPIVPSKKMLIMYDKTRRVEVQSPLNRIYISYNRRGHRAFAVFLLSFFIGMCCRAVSAVGCCSRLSIWIFTFSKIQIGGRYGEVCTKKGIYQKGWRLCGAVLSRFLPPQASRPELHGQAVYPRAGLPA